MTSQTAKYLLHNTRGSLGAKDPTPMHCLSSSANCQSSSESPLAQYEVASVQWRGHAKRLRIEPGRLFLDVPLSACVARGDKVRLESGDAWVVGRNGDCQIFGPYIRADVITLGGVEHEVLIKEITEYEEHVSYLALANYHYRGKVIHGRTARLIVRTVNPRYPKVLGYIELATPFFMNKPRSQVLDAPFKAGPVNWNRWNIATLRKHIHVVVRIARTVVSPEFRGANIGQLLIKHAESFARSRWQVSGYLPSFMEISADMLKFVPFAERAGMTFVGNTEGNLQRVARDMRYLITRFRDDPDGKTEFEEISGILDQQIARMDRAIAVMEREGIELDALYEKLDKLSQQTVLKQFALFHGIVSLPKPHYMLGLSDYASRFLSERVQTLGVVSELPAPSRNIDSLQSPIALESLNVEYRTSVRRTFRTHAVQQAFDISPDEVNTPVIKDLNVNVLPGNVVLIVGPSGSGKSSLVRLFAIDELPDSAIVTGRIRYPMNMRAGAFKEFRSKKPLIDALGVSDVGSALYLLGLAGLSEPKLYLKRFQELSGGQQYRAMLCRLMASSNNVWVADEFCANLDPATARVVAGSVQRIARRLGVTAVVAAPHCETFLTSLRPDLVIVLESGWGHTSMSGDDYAALLASADSSRSEIPRIRVETDALQALDVNSEMAVVWHGRKQISRGLNLVCDDRDSVVAKVKSSSCKSISRLSDDDAKAAGFSNAKELKKVVSANRPEIRDRSLVTVVEFEPLLKS